MKFFHLLAFIASIFTPALSLPEPLSPALQPRAKDPAPVGTKYFHEPGGGDVLGHYDIRYFKGNPVAYEEKQDTLRHLIQSYLAVFRQNNIETWIAHGTLLGWWWNGKIMPWDWDLDTQVSASTLIWMGENMNMTFHNYTFPAHGMEDEHQREYLLDVNPHVTERVRGDGLNIIDARWIDTKTGLFIDITGLSETEPRTSPGVWSCKNYHRYRTREIYPLRETIFEGTPALVPFAFDDILTTEYSVLALTNTLHEGHQWIPDQKAWVRINNPDIQGEFKQRKRNKNNSNNDNIPSEPHIPRSLRNSDETPTPGLKNLLQIL